jgi:hypothetical protein
MLGFHLDTHPSRDCLIQAIAEASGVPANHVHFYGSNEALEHSPSVQETTGASVWAWYALYRGEFDYELNIVGSNTDLYEKQFHFAQVLCRRLRCRLLVGDWSINPYTFYLFSPDDTIEHVALVVDREDSTDIDLPQRMDLDAHWTGRRTFLDTQDLTAHHDLLRSHYAHLIK